LIRAYFDSSAIMKLNHDERESQALLDYLDEVSIEAATSVVAEVDVMRNLRKFHMDADEAIRGFHLIALDEDIRRTAVETGNASLKSLDAIHVATALAIGDRELQFVTYDERQAEAARAAGLKVVQPGR
jgi:predicted nucleic acid-binding protein